MMAAMTRDYASRSGNRRSPSTRVSRKTGKRSKPEKKNIWSAPSFSAGAIFGAALVLLASYAPTAFEDTVSAARGEITQPDQIDFDFTGILENGTVQADPDAYVADFPGEDPDAPLLQYEIQAISVRSVEKARSLSTELAGMGLNARYERVDLSSGTWYRVVAGPYNSKRETDQVMNRLRDRNMLPSRRTLK